MSRIIANNIRHNDATVDNLALNSNGRVGIGGSHDPITLLDMRAAGGPIAKITATDDTNARIRIQAGDTSQSYLEFGDASDDDVGEIVYDHSNNSMRFRTNGAERARILSTGGLTFNGDTDAANALDDYEEGTWTPVITSDAGSDLTGTTVGAYVKVGGTVLVYGAFFNASLTGASGALRLTGLPFTVRNRGSNYYNAPGIGWYVNLATTSYGLGLDIAPNQTRATLLRGTGTGISGLSASDCNTNFGVEWGFTYEAA
jgi:hypothetical protein